jgi:hypothetical protein
MIAIAMLRHIELAAKMVSMLKLVPGSFFPIGKQMPQNTPPSRIAQNERPPSKTSASARECIDFNDSVIMKGAGEVIMKRVATQRCARQMLTQPVVVAQFLPIRKHKYNMPMESISIAQK